MGERLGEVEGGRRGERGLLSEENTRPVDAGGAGESFRREGITADM